jgi:hypothetical protein
MINETPTFTNFFTGTIVLVTFLMVAFLVGRNRKRQSAPPVHEGAIVALQPQKTTLTTELPSRTFQYPVAEIPPGQRPATGPPLCQPCKALRVLGGGSDSVEVTKL